MVVATTRKIPKHGDGPTPAPPPPRRKHKARRDGQAAGIEADVDADAGAEAATDVVDGGRAAGDVAAPLSPAVELAISPDGPCEHVVEDTSKGQLVFQRYCHVYREGELEALCEEVGGCAIVETGWDKGNWTVLLKKEL